MLIGGNISSYPSLSCLSSWDKFDCTSSFPISVCQTIHLSACPSILPWLCWQFHQAPSFCPSVCLSGCLSCPGCVDSSSVSCRRSVLLRHGHWSDACTLSADGQATILSHTFFSSNFLAPQKFILPDPSLAAALNLSFCDLFPSPSPFIADHLVAGKLTERKTGRGRQIGNIQSPPLKGSAQKVCQPSPKRPKASFPSSSCPPCCACT